MVAGFLVYGFPWVADAYFDRGLFNGLELNYCFGYYRFSIGDLIAAQGRSWSRYANVVIASPGNREW